MADSFAEFRHIVQDPEMRFRVTEIISITALLDQCIIDKNFRLSDQWTEPIKLSALGDEVVAKSMAQHRRLKPNDVRLAVFMYFGCAAGLLVDLSTDIEGLRAQISSEVVKRRVKFPYIFGRELHDTAAKLFPGRTQLDNSQTIKLLDLLPIGAFQEGRTIVGPYGCTYSDQLRQIGSSTSVPGYLCSDETCSAVHSIFLTTADSSISKARGLVADLIEKHYSEVADDHVDVTRDAFIMEYAASRLDSSDNLIDVLSDGLSEDELRYVIDSLLRRTFKTEGRRRDISRRLGAAIANPSDFVNNINRPNLMQIALLHTDRDIIAAIEESVHTGRLEVKEFEVRVSKVRRWDPGADEPHAEIGALGVRFAASPVLRLVAQRMFRLLHSIYYESDLWDAADLAYALAAPPDLSDAELLDRAVREFSPRDLFTLLILPNRRAVTMAAERLGVTHYEGLSRDNLLERLLWKIGEPDAVTFRDLQRIREHSTRLGIANEEGRGTDALRSEAINLFTAAEDALSRSLIFCTWAFHTDHSVTTDGFVYDPLGSSTVLEFIETNAPVDDQELRLALNGANSLMALSAGFARLAKALRKQDPESHRRPAEQIPAICAATSRPFAFPFTIPWLNLAESARSDILVALQSVSRLMQDDDVIDLRNSTAHGNRPFPDKEHVRQALERIDSLVHYLETTGFYPHLFDLTNLSRDRFGREELVYECAAGKVSLFRPQWAVAPRFPMGAARLLIMPTAKTMSSGPLRFRLKPRPGEDPYWKGWPKRWHIKSEYRVADRTPPSPDEFSQSA